MKLQSQNRAKLPKYAAALMCLTVMPMLTGCRSDVALDGTAPIDVPPVPSNDSIELGGETYIDSNETYDGMQQFALDSQDMLHDEQGKGENT